MKIFFAALLSSFSLISMAQPGVEWCAQLPNCYSELGTKIDRLTDGSLILGNIAIYDSISAPADYHGSADFHLVKMDISGNIIWQKCFGSTMDDELIDLQATPDGGCIAVGYTEGSDGNVTASYGDYDIWVIKVSANGTLQWQKSFGNVDWQEAFAVTYHSDGYYYIAAASETSYSGVTGFLSYNEVVIIKISSTGIVSWQKAFGGSDYDMVYDIVSLSNGNIAFCGSSNSSDGDLPTNHGEDDGWIVSITTSGSKVFSKVFGGSNADYLFSIIDAGSGNIVCSGLTVSSDGDITSLTGIGDIWLMKINSSGNLVWSNTFGFPGKFIQCYSLAKTGSGDFVLPGSAYDGLSLFNSCLVKADANGSEKWKVEYFGINVIFFGQVYVSPSDELFISGTSDDPNSVFPGTPYGVEFIASMGDVDVVKDYNSNEHRVYYSDNKLWFVSNISNQFSCNVYNLSGKIVPGHIDQGCFLFENIPASGIYFARIVDSSGDIFSEKFLID